MTSEVATVDEHESALQVLPPAQLPSVSAQRMLIAHAEMMQTAYELAAKMVNTRMVPARFFGKSEDATAAILYGAELGLNPIQSLQRVIPIHGMPSLEARTMVALLKSRGYKVKTLSQSDTSVTVWGKDLEGDEYESTWTIERAIKARYVPELDERTGKYKTNANGKLIGNEKYITDPQAMLKAKAQSEVCRDMAPDVLLGIAYSREELESELFDGVLPTSEPARGAAPVTVEEILGEEVPTPETAADEPEAEAQPQPEPAADEAQTEADTTEADPEPDPAPEPAAAAADPEPVAGATKSQTRLALERRLFKLLAIADISRENRADRILIYRFIIGRDDIDSTDDLNSVEVAEVCDVLYAWDKEHELGGKVTDILNSATLAAESTQDSTNEPEGN